MSQVTLTIGGKPHRVSCADGEEAHLVKLGAMIDDKLTSMGGNLSAQETENLLFAAILLADELHEAKQKAPEPAPQPTPESERPDVAPKLDQLAEMLELCADKLETAVATS
ncbi:MAG: cell division protein ZapA [Erythrobacter sp.]